MDKDIADPLLNNSFKFSEASLEQRTQPPQQIDSDDSFHAGHMENFRETRAVNRYREDSVQEYFRKQPTELKKLPTSKEDFSNKMRESLTDDFKEMIYEGRDNPERHYQEKYLKRLMGASDFFESVAKDVPLNELL